MIKNTMDLLEENNIEVLKDSYFHNEAYFHIELTNVFCIR